jgi:hypothetical protein
MSILAQLTKNIPARRHRCEIENCLKVFECHLCEIDWTHPTHGNHRQENHLIYICKECAIKTGRTKIITISKYKHGSYGTLYDYITGKQIKKFKMTHRIEKRWQN